jgi:hypothetical protein
MLSMHHGNHILMNPEYALHSVLRKQLPVHRGSIAKRCNKHLLRYADRM